jgi:hypothetical protein
VKIHEGRVGLAPPPGDSAARVEAPERDRAHRRVDLAEGEVARPGLGRNRLVKLAQNKLARVFL